MSDGDPEERAEKLQSRFGMAEEGESSEAANSSRSEDAPDTPESSTASKASNTPQADDATPLRDRPTKLLYMEEAFKEELELAFDELNLRYKRERGDELHQNEDWWPVLLRIGFEAIGDVREVDLERFDEARAGQFTVREEEEAPEE